MGKGKAEINKHREVGQMAGKGNIIVQGLKNTILSVGQMACKGNILVFTLTKCKDMDEETRKVIERGYRNLEKLYVLAEKNICQARQ